MKIDVLIVDNSQSEPCQASCGVDWSSGEAITLARQRIKERFGAPVRLEYLDLSRASGHLELKRKVKDLPLPVLVINGETRVSGQFDTRMLLDVIDAALEISLEGGK